MTRSSRTAVSAFGALGDLAEHRRTAEIDQPIRDAPKRRIRREARRVIGAATLDGQNQ
jgi:hypothetical protein